MAKCRTLPVKNSITLLFGMIWMILAGEGLAGGAAYADGCWVEFYDQPHYKGKRLRIIGPADLPSLKNLHAGDWSNRAQSLIVGPQASILVRKEECDNVSKQDLKKPIDKAFSEQTKNLSEQEALFGPGRKQEDLSDRGFGQSINALIIHCLL